MNILNSFLNLYNLENSSSILISSRKNIVYKIEANQAYALKIYSHETTPALLINEVEWLRSLREDTNLLVPRPLPNQQGQMISQLGDRFCILFEWLEGEPVHQNMSVEVARQIGEMMAKLHLHASSYRPKRDIINHYDFEYFFGFSSWWETKAQKYLLDCYKDFVPAVNKAKHLFKSLNKSPEDIGLIHSDLHLQNVISNGKSLAIIDFGLCGLGHYITDIILTVMSFGAYPNAKQLISSFREGYQSFRDYFPSSEDLKTFEVIQGLFFLKLNLEKNNKNLRKYFIYIAMRDFWSLERYKILKYFVHKGLIFVYIELLIKAIGNQGQRISK